MTVNILIIFILLAILMLMFFWEPIPADFIALSVPVVLVLLKGWTNISINDALSGFSNTATITVLAMFILSSAVQKYGFVQVLGEQIEKLSKGSNTLRYFIVITIAGLAAAILNNTPVVAIFIPLVIRLAHKSNSSPSKILLPLSYASMLGGTLTLLGSSTNLLASGISDDLIDHPFSIFEFTSVGLVLFAVGIVYLLTIGKKLTPARIHPKDDLAKSYKIKDYLSILKVDASSVLVDHSIKTASEEHGENLEIIDIIRERKESEYDPKKRTIKADDLLVVHGQEDEILELTESYGLQALGENRLDQKSIEEENSEKELIEIIIPIGSRVIGQTLNDLDFTQKHHAILFSIRRRENLSYENLDELTLRAGDSLLLKGDQSSLKRLKDDQNYVVVRNTDPDQYDRKKMYGSLGILLGVIALTIIDFLPIVISSLLGVILMIASGLLKPHEAYEAVDWSVIFLLAGLIPLGTALEKTGATSYLAEGFIHYSKDFPLIIVLGLFYLFTALFTNFLSNNAAVILMLPIAVDLAQKMGANPFAFVMAVTFAASTAFLTPIGYQTNLMVYGPGAYKFSDYLKVGAPLQIILAVITPILIKMVWGL
ncbi:MAG: SLC13 family permease [Atopostipes suicloacalis]|nr:SLC13 family permease [Atopostipes suicloacalis]MDN6731610.1 SLC13 family permease [Atopostipes suicloacalis]